MAYDWVPRALIPIVTALMFALFRRYAPPRPKQELDRSDRAESDRLPTGAFALLTVGLGLVIAVGGFFALREANHLFGRTDRGSLLQTFPVSAIWCFLPGFAGLIVPWPLAIAWLRTSRFRDDAAYIEREGSAKSGFDCYRVMMGFVVFLVLPGAIFTLFALPERLTFTDTEILWTHYASLRPERFAYAQARRATLIDGYRLRDGSFRAHRDLVIDFADGRRLSANAVGDGGSSPSREEIQLVLRKTGLNPSEVQTIDSIR